MPAKKTTKKKAATKKTAKKKAAKKKVAKKKAAKKTAAAKVAPPKVELKKAAEKPTARAKTATAMATKSTQVASARKGLDSLRKETAKVEKARPYWMVCPKCGANMKEIEYKQVKIDKCSKCQGVYFDRGELDLVIRQFEKKGFITRLRSIF